MRLTIKDGEKLLAEFWIETKMNLLDGEEFQEIYCYDYKRHVVTWLGEKSCDCVVDLHEYARDLGYE